MAAVKEQRWSDPIYGVTFRLRVGPYAVTKSWVEECDITAEPGGAAQVWFIPERMTALIWVSPDFDNALQVAVMAAHEALHLTLEMSRVVGLQLSTKSEEAFAYYLGWVAGEITERVLSSYQPKKRRSSSKRSGSTGSGSRRTSRAATSRKRSSTGSGLRLHAALD